MAVRRAFAGKMPALASILEPALKRVETMCVFDPMSSGGRTHARCFMSRIVRRLVVGNRSTRISRKSSLLGDPLQMEFPT